MAWRLWRSRWGLFGIAEFLNSINRIKLSMGPGIKLRLRDMRPTAADLSFGRLPHHAGNADRQSLFAHSLEPALRRSRRSSPYAAEKKLSKTPERFGHGRHSRCCGPGSIGHIRPVQGDFIPTMSLGIPGDAVMALMLGALIMQGISPGPQLISEHPDVFWGLIASFWVGNILLVVLNVPMIGIWVKLLSIPYKFLYPSALLFVCIGVLHAPTTAFSR